MANDKKKKIILIVVLVLAMIMIGMSLNSCSNSVEEDKVVQKKTIKKKTKSQATTKIDEKKDESKIKQEEKKEETAKADSSNKSNFSESKKDNTASTSSSSNKNNTSSSKSSNSSSNNSGSSKPSNNSGSNSSSSKPAEHKHDWVAQYKTVNVPEKGHNEQVLVQAAYDEQVPITEMREFSICNVCGADITNNTTSHTKAHALAGEGGGYHSEWREVVTRYKTVHHDAVYETKYVVDSPATTKQELTGYKCSGCGKTRSN